jgi:hypothetical protein
MAAVPCRGEVEMARGRKGGASKIKNWGQRMHLLVQCKMLEIWYVVE